MRRIRFRVDEVFDLSSRSGLVACGTLLDGEELIGLPVFVDEMTGRPVHVLGVDFPTPRTRRTGQHLLIVSRDDIELVTPGRTWVS
ncbi:hypothetical protein [Micromonospora sp. RTGN7]|uniref:hypothetical protein n=1 Tax=Micromonospora sp. RTGN7 TaxID=3016526 RepID=UPI0029FF0B12|nr:hypothetical protein [Micromonospora sp. RTGN7]